MGQISKVGVIGLGTMGAGIAEVFARNGFEWSAWRSRRRDRPGPRAPRGLDGAGPRARQADRGRAAEIARADHGSRRDFAALADCDLVVEAVRENLDLKKEIFGQARRRSLAPHAILATNTSSLSVTEIAVATSRPAHVVGMHFFNPAPVPGFVEVVRTVVTVAGRRRRGSRRSRESLGKQPVVVGDRAGFIANALLFGYLNHAVSMYESQLRHPRGHRRGDAPRLRLPDGPAGAARPDRPRHRLRDPRHDVQAGPRPPARPGPDPQADGHRRAARAASRAAASTPTRRPARPVVARRASPTATPLARSRARRCRRSASSAPGRWPRGIVEVFAKAGYDVIFVARSEERSPGALPRIETSLGKAVDKGKLAGR